MSTATAAPESLAAATLTPLLDGARRWRRFLDATTLRPEPTLKWTTPNTVLLEHPAMQLREFWLPGEAIADRRAAAHTAGALPLLLVAPEVNGSSIADYGPSQSFVHAALTAGFGRVAVVHWRTATEAIKHHRIEDSIGAVNAAIDALGGRLHLAGICQGGWEAAIVAATRPDAVASLTAIAAAIDFEAGDASLHRLVEAVPQEVYEGFVAAGGGVMRGAYLNQGFTMLQAWDRLVVNPLRIWNGIDDPKAAEHLDRFHAWYDSLKDLPGPMYLRVVEDLFRKNLLIRGEFTLDGVPVDLARITCPVAMVAGTRDHITPPEQVFALDDACSAERTKRWAIDAGHVGVSIGRAVLRDEWPTIFAWLRAQTPDGPKPSPPADPPAE